MTVVQKKYLADVLAAIALVEEFVAGVSDFSDYQNDDKTKSAVERQLIIIGEAIAKLRSSDDELDLEHAPQIVGFRNRLVHAYDSIDDSMVWTTIKKHLLPLKEEVENLLNGEKNKIMNKYAFLLIFVLFIVILCNSCGRMNDEPTNHCSCFERDLSASGNWWENPSDWEVVESNFVGIENISFENYPKVDGSTSTNILNTMIACKLLGVRYKWMPPLVEEWFLQYNFSDIPELYNNFFGKHVMTSQTHGAFMNLIDGNADVILTHRTISSDEKAHADATGVTLIETPIALDAFVFVVNKNNPVKSLTVNQIQKIYTKEITNWAQVDGNNADMKVFTRPRNSGSEEVFRTLVMNGLEPADFPEAAIGSMAWVFKEVIDNVNSICYSFNTYKNLQARKLCDEVPVIAINSICPTEKTLTDRIYPFISEVRVAIRSDLNHNSMAYKLYEWLQSENAKYTITECGFLPK